ncbi:hypothetical protein [Rhizobacter sp. SG703]|uniref:hypothetical protein n=1 Tax=Rhizobacter sp. SG703 TaxID=2587140 RepID=UPI0014459485|nr:hypothetical protein [Rhizobacter sp. SG703]NKI92740.1 hypothetical protein [Rhizobacter sp. SG703]
MFLLKLALVCAVVLAASVAAKRFGHGVAGTLSGLPMIAGPIMGFVLPQAPLSQAHAIAVATIVAYPAMVSHMVAFAHAVRRWPWWVALLAANAVFLAVGSLLAWVALPLPAACVLAALAPWAGLRSMPAHRRERTVLRIPPIELVLRVAAAAALAAAIMGGASVFPAAVSGLLLALPITGNVLPCFTRARHGADATIELLAGFLRGMVGFGAFFMVLALALPTLGAGLSYATAWGVVLVVAWVLQRHRGTLTVPPVAPD